MGLRICEEFICRNKFVAIWCHIFSRGVASSGKFSKVHLKWAPPTFLIKYIVLVTGDLMQS